MPKIHEVKTWPEHFIASSKGQKKATIRKNDRNYQVGDLIISKEFNPQTKGYTGEQCTFEITHKLSGFGLEEGYVMLSIRRIYHNEKINHDNGDIVHR